MERKNDKIFGAGGMSEFSGLTQQEQKFYDGVESMKRLKVEAKMFEDVDILLCDMAKNLKVYSLLGRKAKKIRDLRLKEVFKAHKRGLKEIDKNIPVFVELPKYEKKGDGYTVKNKGDLGNEEIIINDMLQQTPCESLEMDSNTEILPSAPPTDLIE